MQVKFFPIVFIFSGITEVLAVLPPAFENRFMALKRISGINFKALFSQLSYSCVEYVSYGGGQVTNSSDKVLLNLLR